MSAPPEEVLLELLDDEPLEDEPLEDELLDEELLDEELLEADVLLEEEEELVLEDELEEAPGGSGVSPPPQPTNIDTNHNPTIA